MSHQAWPLITSSIMLLSITNVPTEENISESTIIGNVQESEDSMNDEDNNDCGATAVHHDLELPVFISRVW